MKNSHGVFAPTSPVILLGLLVTGLQSFSVVGAGFLDPDDAPTLRMAMITGSSSGDDAEYWKCAVGDGSVVLQYRLLADGTGVENVLANPKVSSTFTWETNSATSATSLVDASGVQNDLSNIRFTDRNSMSLLVAQSVPLACARQGGKGVSPDVPAAPAADNTLSSSNGQKARVTDSGNVSEQNRPVASYTYLEQSWVGFPAMLTFEAEVAYYFPNGYTVYCANWDPRYLDPTPDSVGRAIEGCDVKKERPKEGLEKGFKTGQTIDISFGNISAGGFDMGGSSSSSLSGSTLRMTRDGQIAIGKFNAFSVASGGNGAGGGNKKRALVGTYVLDGHLITIVTDAGEELVGFASWGSDSGSSQVDHVFINGEHFWNRTK